MYKLVIVDDETMIRKGLSNSIDWVELGFELVASFEDGTDVLEYIKKHPVDVILSDIVMCNIGGLEIAKYVYENHLPVKIVLMSGYQDFKFAHDAIRYQVFDYLLKPIANKEIEEKFKLLNKTLNQTSNIVKTTQSQDDREIADCITDMQTVMMNKIWNEQYIDKEIVGLVSSATKIELSNENNAVIFMCQCTNRVETIRDWIRTCEKDLVQNGCIVSPIDEEHVLGIFTNVKRFDEDKQIRKALMLLSDDNHSFFFVKKKHFSLQSADKNIDVKDIVTFIKNAVLYLQILDKLEDTFTNSLKMPDNIDGNFKLQIFRLVIEIFCMRICSVKITDELIQFIFANIDLETKTGDLLKTLYNKLVTIQNGPFDDNYDFAIEKVRKYIKIHLNEDISVNTLAEMVHLNSAYFGRYFKKATFKTVKQYIYEKRMELAIELLAQKKYTVVEIAKMVGYNFKYFFPLFKKYTGYTPKDYLKYFID